MAAIAGAICGANSGADAIPAHWIGRLREWPRTVEWMTELAKAVSTIVSQEAATKSPSMCWLASVPRNLVFATVVLSLGFRRLFPPY